MITSDQLEALTDDPLEAYLVTLFESGADLFGGEIERGPDLIVHTLIYRAWDEIAQRTTLRVITSEPLDEGSFEELTLDLIDYLGRERQRARDEYIRRTVAEGTRIGEAQALASDYADAYTPDHVALYVMESQIDNDILLADLRGAYNPEIVLHIVPDDLLDGGAQ